MSDFISGLVADGPEPSLAAELDLYGRLVGTWRVANRFRSGPDADWVESERTWIFAWIAGGRAVQDVIIGSDRGGEQVVAGTTVRALDTRTGVWRINWFGTLHSTYATLAGSPLGADGIVQAGVEHTPEGDVAIDWNFERITPDSFEWNGWSTFGTGTEPWLEQHMEANRIA